jgi:hypothetical protein
MEPPAEPERPRRRLGWPTVVIALATLLIGGFIGYAAGRPNTSPPVHGELSPGQVRVPDLRETAAKDARGILAPFDLQVGAIGLQPSQAAPNGIVVQQAPPSGAVVPAGTAIDLVASSGPGPGASAAYDFAWGVLIPITHAGALEWTSDPIALAGDPLSLGANTRVIGAAGVSPYRISESKNVPPGATAITVSVEVSSFHAPAWFVIERAFTRQREASSGDAALRVAPPSGPPGAVLSVEGSQCQGSPAATSVSVTAEFSRGNAAPFATLPLPLRGSAYAFRMAFIVPGSIQSPTGTRFVLPGDRLAFTTSGGACHSSSFRVT